VRLESDGMYLDYVKAQGTTRSTAIRLGGNMQDMHRDDDTTRLCTRLIPLGAKIGDTVEYGSIANVNTPEGQVWIPTGMEESRGIINKTHRWDGVSNPATLLQNAQGWVAANNEAIHSYRLTALDLSLLGLDPDAFRLGDSYPVRNEPLGVDTTLRVIGITLNLSTPEKGILDFGDKHVLQTELERAFVVDRVGEVTDLVGQSSAILGQGISEGLTGLQSEIFESSTQVLQEATAFLVDAISYYVRTQDFQTYQQTVTNTFTVMGDGFAFNFDTLTQVIGQLDSNTSTSFQDIQKYIRLVDGDIVLGQVENPYQCVITLDAMQFRNNGVAVAYLNNNMLFVDRLQVISEEIVGPWRHRVDAETSDYVIEWIGYPTV
jgi:hypothetical protein